MEKIVDRLAHAKIGDWVLLRDYQARQNSDKVTPYIITGETRTSWLACAEGFEKSDFLQSKFAKDTGVERRRDFADRIFGKLDWEDLRWREHHAYRIGNVVKSLGDVGKLKMIAEIIGYNDQG